MRRLIRAAAGLAAVIGLAGCGTATFDNQFSVTVTDLSGTAPEGVRVSVFDNQMGDSQEWADKTMGTSSPEQPYTTTVFATETQTVLDSGAPKHIRVGMSLPDISTKGYWWIDYDPVPDQEQTFTAPFTLYGMAGKPDKPVAPITITAVNTATDSGWQVRMQVAAPLKAPQP